MFRQKIKEVKPLVKAYTKQKSQPFDWDLRFRMGLNQRPPD